MKKLNTKDTISIIGGILLSILTITMIVSSICSVCMLTDIKSDINNISNELNEIKNVSTNTDATVSDATPTQPTMTDATPTDVSTEALTTENTTEDVITVITTEIPVTTEEITTEEIITTEEVTTTEVVEETTEYTSEEITIEPILSNIDGNVMAAGLYEQNSTTLTDEEFVVVCQVVMAECGFGTEEQRMHIAHTIYNRVIDDRFPDNIIDVCYQPNQFAMRSDINQGTVDAVIKSTQIDDTTGGAIAFHSNEYSDTFFGLEYIFTDGAGVHFYK